jgi:FkbH-like protein
MLISTYTGPYGQYRQQLLDPPPSLNEFAPNAVLLSLSAEDALPAIPLDAGVAEVDEAIGQFLRDLRLLWRRAQETWNAVVIQQNFLNTANTVFGSYDRLMPAAPRRRIERLNHQLDQAAAQDGVLILDVASASQRDGIISWFDPVHWFQGKLEIAPQASPVYGDMVARILAAQRGISRKCLVLDLDNTLWGGIIGDDGLDGILIGQGSAVGEAYLAFQHYAKQLKERGVILAVCTKNDADVAEAVFSDHPEMALRRSDFAAFVADWNDKTQNLQIIAKQLNIGLDSLVFVDDNPVERARIRQSLPMVAVPELPEDPAYYPRCIADAGYFEAVDFTAEDRDRAHQYVANAEREALFKSAQSVEDFLRGLNMSVVHGPFMPVDHPRVVQLINKTNQFNTTTRRYTTEEITQITNSPTALTLQFRLLDRIGDNGLVSAMVMRPVPGQDDVLEIENWVMSCRVFGRQLEFEAMNIAVEAAQVRGARALVADYVATTRNGLIKKLYPTLGFTQVGSPAIGGAIRWYLCLADYVARKSQITRAASLS